MNISHKGLIDMIDRKEEPKFTTEETPLDLNLAIFRSVVKTVSGDNDRQVDKTKLVEAHQQKTKERDKKLGELMVSVFKDTRIVEMFSTLLSLVEKQFYGKVRNYSYINCASPKLHTSKVQVLLYSYQKKLPQTSEVFVPYSQEEQFMSQVYTPTQNYGLRAHWVTDRVGDYLNSLIVELPLYGRILSTIIHSQEAKCKKEQEEYFIADMQLVITVYGDLLVQKEYADIKEQLVNGLLLQVTEFVSQNSAKFIVSRP